MNSIGGADAIISPEQFEENLSQGIPNQIAAPASRSESCIGINRQQIQLVATNRCLGVSICVSTRLYVSPTMEKNIMNLFSIEIESIAPSFIERTVALTRFAG